jgi:signal transduction histidine kinase
MPVDYRRLVEGLGSARCVNGPELSAVRALVVALCESVGAAGGTFTEYAPQGGRVVVAEGALAWALGQPVPAELVPAEGIARPFVGRVDSMPAVAAQPLLTRGIGVVAGHPIWSGERVVGALHVFFDALAIEDPASSWQPVSLALRVVAGFAEGVYTGREAAPIRATGEEDDRSLFLAVAGHELRTPVTVVKGYARLLADRWEVLDDDQRNSATRALTQRADELARLVDRLLAVSGGDSSVGGLVRTVPFDLLGALVDAVSAMPEELRRLVRVAVPNSLPPAAGDPEVVGIVVNELVTNAVRATDAAAVQQVAGPGSPVTVDVTAGADAETVYVRVLDRGVGIDPAQAERAFERFWRGTGSAGVGLGLYLVRRLVERQNGWVSLRPRDGGGTIAEVRLSRADGPPRSVTGEA